MKSYLFFTDEGFTLDKSNKATNNMQILGLSSGNSFKEAFKNFKEHQSYLYSQDFKNIMAIKTVGDVITDLKL